MRPSSSSTRRISCRMCRATSAPSGGTRSRSIRTSPSSKRRVRPRRAFRPGAPGCRHRWSTSMRERLRIVARGAVQGVGFRPFVYRLAHELGLDGWGLNSPQGVFIEIEGDHAQLEACLLRIERDRPPRSVIHSLESSWLDAVPYRGFEIRESAQGGAMTALVLPDIAMCDDCRREVHDPADRRYRYPFTNCTNCGPRFSIIDAMPYDRANTSMRTFEMCPACQGE